MKIGILHISDIHIEKDNLTNLTSLISKAIDYDTKDISYLFIAISGDIVKHGRKDEYTKAKEFIISLNDNIIKKNKIMPIKIILVPGNHDCCFDNVNTTRKLVIDNCRKDIIDDKDYINGAMSVQDNFWNFYEEITNEKYRNEISYKLEYTPHIDFKITFHCYNTSWLTEINETQGKLTIPENKFLYNENKEYVVSIFHHPIDWLSSETTKNNKRRFEEHLINTSNLVIFGHEHDKGKAKNIVQKSNNVVFCGGRALNKSELDETGFSYYEIDLTDKSIITKTYKYNKDNFICDDNDKFKIRENSKRTFTISNDFEKKITQLNIPLKHSKKNTLLLSDIYVYPDLEPLIEERSIVQYPNSEKIYTEIKNKNIYIEGADQSGKTSLLYTLYKRLYEMGYTPLLVNGRYFNDTDIKRIAKKALKEQYDNENIELYFQQESKIILIDNFHKSELNRKYKKVLLEKLEKTFDHILITSNNSNRSDSITEEATSLKDYSKYRILPLGHERRGVLIEQWLQIGENKLTIQEEVLLSNVQLRFHEIDSLIGNKLLPSYPIFILTLLQGLDENLQNFTQTSYANIYLILIKSGLIKEGIINETLTSYLNILKEFAFYLYNIKNDSFQINDFEKFIQVYRTKYFKDQNLTTEKIITTLSNANIFKQEDNYYSFSYKYIYFYLIAQKIAVDIDIFKNLIYELCNNIHLEINANILIFLSHHTKAQTLIDNIIFTSEIPFSKSKSISLDKNDEFVKFITEFTNEIKENIIEDRNPKEEIIKDRKNKDQIERSKPKIDPDSESKLPPEIVEINQAFRIIKIIGQIIKNQSGDFEKEKLISLTESAYNTIFRFLGFFSEILTSEKDQLIEAISNSIKEEEKSKKNKSIDSVKIEKEVRNFLQFISWRICVDSINNLMFSVGTKGQNELFNTVALNINTTASKIVTFAIKTYYDKINITDLENLFEETKGNFLAQCILREYIKKHLYTNIVERSKKDKIINIAGFKPRALQAMENKYKQVQNK